MITYEKMSLAEKTCSFYRDGVKISKRELKASDTVIQICKIFLANGQVRITEQITRSASMFGVTRG